MTILRNFIRNENGASAAEFSMVLPLLLLLLFGTIDFGRFAWAVAMEDKAVQTGARHAVATDMIASGLASYSFVTSGGVDQGTRVNSTKFPGVVCQSSGGTVSCSCKSGGTCSFPLTADTTAFNNLVARMAQIYPGLTAANVKVYYDWSNLGFAGDPNGPDVAPLTTVSVQGLNFTPFFGFGLRAAIPMPQLAATLSMEDGSGAESN